MTIKEFVSALAKCNRVFVTSPCIGADRRAEDVLYFRISKSEASKAIKGLDTNIIADLHDGDLYIG